MCIITLKVTTKAGATVNVTLSDEWSWPKAAKVLRCEAGVAPDSTVGALRIEESWVFCTSI